MSGWSSASFLGNVRAVTASFAMNDPSLSAITSSVNSVQTQLEEGNLTQLNVSGVSNLSTVVANDVTAANMYVDNLNADSIGPSALGQTVDFSVTTGTGGNVILQPDVKTTTVKPISITNSTATTNTTSGAFTVTGGVGIGGGVNVGGTVTADTVNATTMGGSQVNAKSIAITDSENPTTASLAVNGQGTQTLVKGDSVTTATVKTSTLSTSSGDLTITPAGDKTITGKPVELSNTTQSTSNTSGALVVAGGAGIGGNLTVGGTLSANTLNVGTQSYTNINVSGNGTFGGSLTVGTLNAQTIQYTDLGISGSLTVGTITGPTEQMGGPGPGGPGGPPPMVLPVIFASSVACQQNLSAANMNVTSSSPALMHADGASGPLTVTGGIGVAGNVTVFSEMHANSVKTPSITTDGGNLTLNPAGSVTTTAKPITITNTTASSSSTTGALVVTGGVGIGGALQAAGTVTAGAVTTAGTVTAPQVATASGDLTLAPTGLTTTAKRLTVTDGTASTSGTTGALVVTGGVGIGGALQAAGTLTAGAVTTAGTVTAPQLATASGDLTLAPTGLTTTAKRLTVTEGTASTSGGTGALVVTGGIGAGGSICSNTIVRANSYAFTPEVRSTGTNLLLAASGNITTAQPITTTNTTASTSKTSGAVIVSGGVGVAGSVYATEVRADTFQPVGTSMTLTTGASGNLNLEPQARILTNAPLQIGYNGVAFTPCEIISANTAKTGNLLYVQTNTSTPATTYMINSGRYDGANWITPLYCTAGGNLIISGTLTQNSSTTLKDSKPITLGLKELLQVQSVDFTWKDDRDEDEDETGKKRKRKHVGFLAEQVELVAPHLVHESKDGVKGLAYSEFIPWMVQAIRELNAKINKSDGPKGASVKRAKK